MKETGQKELGAERPAASPTDEDLAARAASGSRSAFEELVTRYSARLLHFLESRSGPGSDAEDLVQETFLKAYRNIERFDPGRRFSTWLYTIALRLAISRHRSQGARPLPLDPEGPAHPSPGPQEALIRKEEAQSAGNIWFLARTLKPREYEVLWLRYAEEMPLKDIARTMKRSQVGVRVLLHRSRLRLGQRMRATATSPLRAEAAPAGGKGRPSYEKEKSNAVFPL
jgi:RNA polymerase sigma-70 factor (ECF subfamily)